MIDKSSEGWRRECEIRYVARMRPDQRERYLAIVAQKRGNGARIDLIGAVMDRVHGERNKARIEF